MFLITKAGLLANKLDVSTVLGDRTYSYLEGEESALTGLGDLLGVSYCLSLDLETFIKEEKENAAELKEFEESGGLAKLVEAIRNRPS